MSGDICYNTAMDTAGIASTATGLVGRNSRLGKKSAHTIRLRVCGRVSRKLRRVSGGFVYDGRQRLLIGENILNGSGAIEKQERFVYDGNQIVLEFDKAGAGDVTGANLSHRYLWGPAVDQILADEQITTAGQAGTVVLPLTDNQGTVRDLAVVNSGVTTVVNHRVFTRLRPDAQPDEPDDHTPDGRGC